MDKYDKLMREIVDYLEGTWLSHSRGYLPDRGPIQGSSEAEIEGVENLIGRKPPAAMKAWYRVAGKVPPYLNDHDADFLLRDFTDAQKMTYGLEIGDAWRRPKTMLLFSSRLGDNFLMVDTGIGDPDDPPVFRLGEDDSTHQIVECAFSVFMREMWFAGLDAPARHRDGFVYGQNPPYQLQKEVEHFRLYVIEAVYEEDLTKDEITGPREFQMRWLKELSMSEIGQKLVEGGFYIPYNWVTFPPTP